MKKLTLLLAIALLLTSCRNPPPLKKTGSLSSTAENLDGWVIKIKGSPLGENYKNTFRVEDSSNEGLIF